jgi:hypothetical protein
MVISMAVLTIRRRILSMCSSFSIVRHGREGQAWRLRVYYKRAIDNDDTPCWSPNTRTANRSRRRQGLPKGRQRGPSALRPYLLKAFYGNFE